MADSEEKKIRRQKILDRLNSYDAGLNEETCHREKEQERERWYEREKTIEQSRRNPGF